MQQLSVNAKPFASCIHHVSFKFDANKAYVTHQEAIVFHPKRPYVGTLSLTLSISTTSKSRISNFLLRIFLWWSSRGVNRLKIRQLWLLPHMMGVITPKVSVISSWFDDWLKRKRIIIIRVNIRLYQIRPFSSKMLQLALDFPSYKITQPMPSWWCCSTALHWLQCSERHTSSSGGGL